MNIDPIHDGNHASIGKGNMPTEPFDILKRYEDGSFIWLETAHEIEIAEARLQELCVATPGNYFVFDQKSQQIVAKLSNGFGE
jgi:hypothetical protein